MNRRRLIDKQHSSATVPAPENVALKKLIVKRWQIAISGLIFVAASAILVYYINQLEEEPVYFDDLWKSQWRSLSPCWLLCYRAFAFICTAVILSKVFDTGGAEVFFYYTHWELLYLLMDVWGTFMKPLLKPL